jgi:hypothetical protein
MIETQLVDLLDGASTYQEILGIIVTVFTTLMGALAPTVIGSIIVGILGAVIVGIVSVSVPAFMAAMTSDVYNRFRCNLFCHMQADGSFTQTDLDGIYAQISDDETGMAMIFLQGFVAAAGIVGMTNASHLGFGDPDADCSACCPNCNALWTVMGGAHGTIISQTDEYVEIEASDGGNGNWYVIIHTSDPDVCCQVLMTEFTTGDVGLHGWTDCGTTPTEGVPQHTGLGWGTCVNYLQAQNAAPFTVKFFLANC